jgi:hypothetical protein
MARGRWMSPDFYDDTVLAQCSHSARLLFPALWQLADRCGVFEWDERQIRKHAFGYDEMTMVSFRSLMDELLLRGFIRRAEHGGKTWGLVVNMAKRQTFHKDEKEKHRAVLETAKWEHGLSTVLTPCEPVSSTVPIQLRSESGVLRSETGDLPPEDRAPKKNKTPAAPVANATGFAEATGLWFAEYEKYYGTKPAWGPVNGRKVKELLAQATIEELRVLIPRYFAWAHRDAIKGGHSLWKGHASLIARLDELRADIAKPQRRAVAAVAADREKQNDHNATTDDQAARVAEMVIAKHANRQDPRTVREADHTARGLLAPNQRPSVVALDGKAHAVHRPGARPGTGRSDDTANDANPWGPDPDDSGGDSEGEPASTGES